MMTATICPSVEQLRALTLGQLPDGQSDELFEHLRDCDTCRAELDTVEDSQDSLVASLRGPDELAEFDGEPDCQVAMVKALGALSVATSELSKAGQEGFPNVPSAIGEYEIVRPLGRGGMGSVFLARHTKLGREVALKVLASHRWFDARMKERFEAEMRAVGRLSHPNIVTAHDAREVDGLAVLITEFIDGLDLRQLLQRTGPLPIADACELARQVATALEYTHGQGFVHRDVKPSNVMLSREGGVKLLDLGLARLQYGENQPAEITGTGQAMGTADYVAPEQVTDSRRVDIRADIYSLGCTLFKLLTGTTPFCGELHATAFAKMTAHVSTAPPSLSDLLPNAPVGLTRLVDAMLAKQPDLRPQTPREVSERLAAFTSQANLVGLADRVSKLDPAPMGQSSTLPSVDKARTKKSFLSRRVPLYVAIASGLIGTLLGICLGIVIVIINPDGTTTRIIPPEGSQILLESTDAKGTSAATDEKRLDPYRGGALDVEQTKMNSIPTGPLFFAVLVSKDFEPSAVDQAKRELHLHLLARGSPEAARQSDQLENSELFQLKMREHELLDTVGKDHPAVTSIRRRIVLMQEHIDKLRGAEESIQHERNRLVYKSSVVLTDIGAWYPLADNVIAPVEASADGQRYALVDLQPSSMVAWEDLRGHLGLTITGNSQMQFFFDPPLANKFEEVSGKHIDGYLGIIVNDRIVSAPRIVSTISDKAQITGKFTQNELRYLMQSLNGGLVDPLEPEPARPPSQPEPSPQQRPLKQSTSRNTPAEAFAESEFGIADAARILTEVQRMVATQHFDADHFVATVSAAVFPGTVPAPTYKSWLDGFQKLEPLKSIREVHRDLPSNGQWLANQDQNAYRLKVDYEFLWKDLEAIVEVLSGTKGVFRDTIEGIKKDPNGPRVDLIQEFIAYLGDEITFVISSPASVPNRQQQWLVAFSVEDPSKMQATVQRLLEKQPGNASKFITMRIAGEYLLCGSSSAVEQAVARHK